MVGLWVGWVFATTSRFIVEGGGDSCAWIFNAACVCGGLVVSCFLNMKTILGKVKGR